MNAPGWEGFIPIVRLFFFISGNPPNLINLNIRLLLQR